MNLWFDGSGWNGKTAAFAVVAEDDSVLAKEFFHNPLTNNETEYMGAIKAAQLATTGDTLYTDSQLVEGHVNKGWKINFDHLQKLYDQLVVEIRNKKLTIVWVPRNQNKAGKVFE
jgi:ribonuclease HI